MNWFRRRRQGGGDTHAAPADWDLTQDPHQGVYMTGWVFDGVLPVLRVLHDADGDLQFLDDVHDVDVDTAHLVCLHDAVSQDPALHEAVRSLRRGHEAQRETVDAPWSIQAAAKRDE